VADQLIKGTGGLYAMQAAIWKLNAFPKASCHFSGQNLATLHAGIIDAEDGGLFDNDFTHL
jgi:hypothetical protein